jgi:CheY-like chemotaxis protein
MLPKMNGIDMIKMLRKQRVTTPTIMLTAKSEIDDKIIGLDAGADDYMVITFSTLIYSSSQRMERESFHSLDIEYSHIKEPKVDNFADQKIQ